MALGYMAQLSVLLCIASIVLSVTSSAIHQRDTEQAQLQVRRMKRDQFSHDENDVDLEEEADRRKRPFGSGSSLFGKSYGAKRTHSRRPDDLDLYSYLHKVAEEKRNIGPWLHLRKWPVVEKRPFGPWTSQMNWRRTEMDDRYVDKRPFTLSNWGPWKNQYTGEAYDAAKRPFGSGSWSSVKRSTDDEDYERILSLLRQASDVEDEQRNKRPFGSNSHKWGSGGRWDREMGHNNVQIEKRPFGPSIIRVNPVKKPFGSGAFGRK